MAGTTATPNMLARDLSRTLKRDVSAKGVRTVARDVLPRFDKTKHPEYQAHVYTAAEVTALRKAFAARGSRAVAQPARKPAKARTAARKPAATPTPDA